MMIYKIKIQQRECRFIKHEHSCFSQEEANGYIRAAKSMLPKGTYDCEWLEYDVEKDVYEKIEWVLNLPLLPVEATL